MRGDSFRKKSTFKKGQAAHNKGQTRDKVHNSVSTEVSWRRPSKEEYKKLTKPTSEGGHCTTDVDGKIGSERFLRPLVSEKQPIDFYKNSEVDRPEMDTYKVLHTLSLEYLLNEAIRGHKTLNPGCTGNLLFDEQRETKIGVCWKESFKCDLCTFTSNVEKLYKEVENTGKSKRGRKTAAPNMALQAGLMTTGVGNTGFRNILLHMNMAAPSMSSMQRLSNQASALIVEDNERDMQTRRKALRADNMAKGFDADSPIAVEFDTRYNNPLNSGAGRTPFQPGTQSVSTACENMSPEKQIIGINIKNKLCKTAQLLRNQGKSISCPNHPGHCSANISLDTSIGDEFTWCKETFEHMGRDEDPLKYKFITTDLDSRSGEALKTVASNSGVDTVNLKCTRHLAQSQRRRTGNSKWSVNMFPAKTGTTKDSLQRQFSYNLARRCTKEFNLCYNDKEGNITKIKRKLTYVRDAIIECYKDNHKLCRKFSYACSGKKKGLWLRSFLPHGTCLNMDGDDEVTLRELIDLRLGRKAIECTKLNTNTQKCESVNRAYSRTNPKNITWSRNLFGRLHTAANMLNHGFANSTVKRLEALGAPLTPGTRVIRQLQSIQKRTQYQREYKKSLKYKYSRAQSRIKLFRLHRNVTHVKRATTYKRDCEIFKFRMDHTYAKKS